ncbi:MAG: hypothetical protein GEU96_04165 [Propionibacteriales bacterium]|nr:hypothetical protein [Propionibacteriales bacterium]
MSPTRRGLAAATLALVGATACATGAGDAAGSSAADRSPPASPAVVIGTVESAHRAETLGPAEDPTTHRIMRVTVEQSFKGEETQLDEARG